MTILTMAREAAHRGRCESVWFTVGDIQAQCAARLNDLPALKRHNRIDLQPYGCEQGRRPGRPASSAAPVPDTTDRSHPIGTAHQLVGARGFEPPTT